MKTKYLTFAALALVLAACEQDVGITPVTPQDDLKDTPITVTAGVAELTTREGYDNDNLPDEFYLSIDQTGEAYDYSNVLMTKATDADTYTTTSNLLWADGSNNASVTAATFSLDGTQILTAENDQSTADGVKNSDHLLMASKSVSPSADGIPVVFSHLMSKVILTITLGDEFDSDTNPIIDIAFKGTVASNGYAVGTGWATIADDAQSTDITPLCNAYTAPTPDKPKATAEYEVILVPQTVAANGFTVQFNIGDRGFKWTSSNEIELGSDKKYTLALTAGKDKVTLGGITAEAWDMPTGDYEKNLETE